MAFIDYYKIMGIPKDTPQKDIRAAYMRRAKQFHPDLHPDDPKAKAKFQALNEAYNVLNDPEKRKKYDKYGESWEQADAYEQAGGFGGGSGSNGFFSAAVGAEVRTPAEVSVRAARDLEQNRMPMLTPRLTLTCTRHCWAAKSCFRRETPNCACA